MQHHGAARFHPAEDAAGECASSGNTGKHPASGGQWAIAHRCTHCPYTHLVALLEQPEPASRYGYICPVTALESIFAADDVMSSQVPRQLRSDEEAGETGTVGGLVWGHRVRDN